MIERNRKGVIQVECQDNGFKDKVLFFEGVNLVGRNPAKTNVTIKDRSVSEVHAKIICRDQIIKVMDAGSKNGVYINDGDTRLEQNKEIQIDPLKDTIFFGQVKCKFVPDWFQKDNEDETGDFTIKIFKPNTKSNNIQNQTQNQPKSKHINQQKKQSQAKLQKVVEETKNNKKESKTKEKNQQLDENSKDNKKTKKQLEKIDKDKQKQAEQQKEKPKENEKQKQSKPKQKQKQQLLKAFLQQAIVQQHSKQLKTNNQQKQIRKAQILERKKGSKKQSKEKVKQLSLQKDQSNIQKVEAKQNKKEQFHKQQKNINKKELKEKNETNEIKKIKHSQNEQSKPEQSTKQAKKQKSKKSLKEQISKDEPKLKQKQQIREPSQNIKASNRGDSSETKVKGKSKKRAKSATKQPQNNKNRIPNRKKMPEPVNDSFSSHPRRSIVQKKALLSAFNLSFTPTTKITIVQNWRDSFDVLVMQKYSRTFKLLYAICLGVPVVSLNWILQSQYRRGIVPVQRFCLQMPFPQKDVISKSISLTKNGHKVFAGLKFYLIQTEQPYHIPMQQLQTLIQTAGGTIVKRVSKKDEQIKNVIFIMKLKYGDDDIKALKKIEGAEKIYSVQMILDSCLMQSIKWDENKISKF